MERVHKRKRGVLATPNAVLQELKRLYWAAVQNEVRNMIEFHNLLKKANYQPHTPSSPECDNFKKMFNIRVGSQPNFDKDSTSNLYHETLRRAQEHLNEPEDNDHWYARFILQSSSLLDIDILYEPTQLSQRYLNVQPNLPNGHHLGLVRYKDPDIAGIRELRAQLNRFGNENEPEPAEEDETEKSETEDESETTNEDHRKGNYKEGKTETKDGDKKQDPNRPATTKRLWQEKLAIKALTSTEAEGSAAQLALRTCALMLKGNLAPAGNFHLSFMFGPLIFESGLRKPPPSLFAQNLDSPQKVQCPFFYRHKADQQLEYQHKPRRIKQRPLLACVKRLYGGSFSCYPASARFRQAEVIKILVKEANTYRSISNTKLVEVKRKLLSDAAGRITRALEECLGMEVDKHLNRITRILVENQTIRGWNMFTNSCQWLVMRLLSGKDFEYIIPRFPDSLGEVHDEKAEEASFGWPRYLVSFGPNIEGFNQSFYQPNSMITDFCQSRPTIDYDLIEYIALRSHASPDTLPTSRVELSLSGAKGANDTTIPMDALWAMPGDTLSMLQFHLLRQPSKYQNSTTGGCLPEDDWNKNRFRVMQLLDTFASLAGALGASLFDLLSRDRQLLSQIIIPSARVFGNILASEQVRIIRLSSRWVAYGITNRVPSAMGEARELRRQLRKAAGAPGDPVHGEEVLSTMVEFFLTPLAFVAGRRAAENLGQIFRFHHNGPWITLNGFEHTLICPLFVKKIKSVRS
ncbi:hypothetical protein DL765_005689 [Monosporascus sp. GIB2]|nr:hypothetical protein DL765_005689 [Monosporascus sp. GIB2]